MRSWDLPLPVVAQHSSDEGLFLPFHHRRLPESRGANGGRLQPAALRGKNKLLILKYPMGPKYAS